MATWRYRGHCIALTLITPHVFKQYLSPFSAAKCSKLELHASMYYISINIASFLSVLKLLVQRYLSFYSVDNSDANFLNPFFKFHC